MPYISNKELDTLIKIENLIGCNQEKLFTTGGEKHYFINDKGERELDYQEKINPKTGVSNDDFNLYLNFVERVLVERDKTRKQANAWNKAHPERHRELNREWARKHKKTN